MIESLYSIPFVGHLNEITDKRKKTWNKKRNRRPIKNENSKKICKIHAN